jgi:chromosome segregation ATPase
MADKQSDFPTLENQAGITPVEAEEIRTEIEKVATENRIPVEAAQFSLTGARRGLFLPSLVNLGALVVVAIAILILGLVFGRTAQRVQTQATQYASIEGKLIRELRQQSTQQLGAKEKEIEEVRSKVHELEQQQQTLAETYNQKLKAKEDELRQKQAQDMTDERARLVSQGVGTDDIARRMARFEAERKAYYEKQLAEYRKGLDVERAQLQADITRLRAEYTTRLDQLEKERRQIVTDFQQRETTLRVQMQQKTEVLDRLRAQSAVNLDAAQRQLAQLGQAQEQVQSVSNQVDGQIARISQDLAAGQADEALAQVRSLQAYIRQGSVRSVSQLSDRLRSESFLLEQLGSLLEDRVKAQATVGTQSLAGELELLSRMRAFSQQAAAASGPARLDAYRQLVASMPEVQGASAALVDAAAQQAVDDLQKKMRDDTEENTKAAVQLIGSGDYAGALTKYKAALNTSPSIAPDSTRLVGDLLALGYRISDYTRTGQKSPGVDAMASQAGIDLQKERGVFLASFARVGTDATDSVTSAAGGQEQELRNQIKDSEARNAQLEAEKKQAAAQADAQRQADLDRIAQQVKTTRDNLNKRLDALLAFENEVNAAHTAYTTYVAQEQAARKANPQDPVTASRQELNKFLRGDAVKVLFPDTADRVNALYAATQTAGSSAALADAADIINGVAQQPSVKASRQKLQFEISNAAGNERLSAILSAVDAVLAKAQGSP